MNEKHSIDLDTTSQSHIYRALRRAESEYGIFGKRLSTNGTRRGDKWLENETKRSKTALITNRTFRRYYSNLMSDSGSIASKEIKSSVRRSRRWAGKTNSLKRQDYEMIPVSDVCLQPETISQLESKHYLRKSSKSQQNGKSAENEYHKTVCDILSNNETLSSYGHVAKMISRTSACKTATKLPSVQKKVHDVAISPVIPYCPSAKTKSQKQLIDITLPSVSPNEKQNREAENYSNIAIPGSLQDSFLTSRVNEVISQATKPEQQHLPNHVKLSKISQILSNDSFHEIVKEVETASLIRKRARRAITTYYDHKTELQDHPKTVVIHLPNPGLPLEIEHKRAPRLLLRKNTEPNLKANELDNCESDVFDAKQKTMCSNLPTIITRVNIRPFLKNIHQISKSANA